MNPPTLFEATAERIALATGRALSQVTLELRLPEPAAEAIESLPLFANATD